MVSMKKKNILALWISNRTDYTFQVRGAGSSKVFYTKGSEDK
jgi:hypothetical protein